VPAEQCESGAVSIAALIEHTHLQPTETAASAQHARRRSIGSRLRACLAGAGRNDAGMQ
jgi:hypothetical protein